MAQFALQSTFSLFDSHTSLSISFKPHVASVNRRTKQQESDFMILPAKQASFPLPCNILSSMCACAASQSHMNVLLRPANSDTRASPDDESRRLVKEEIQTVCWNFYKVEGRKKEARYDKCTPR
ncbi:hypothetical protein Q8A73_003254 [Channa argus]|nr:hypothetical protein Q8A73_003254 [Channa argus]